MICKKCGATNPDNVKFCTACGEPLQFSVEDNAQTDQLATNAQNSFVDQQSNSQQPLTVQQTPKETKPVIAYIIGMLGGLISIYYSFAIKAMSTGRYEYSVTYGGDAYTGIQNAAATTANNVNDIGDLIQTGISGFLLAFGIAVFSYFLMRMLEKK